MSAGRRKPQKRKGKPGKSSSLVLVFGEDENDTKSIRELIEALQPELEGKVHFRRQPLVLIKNAVA